MIKMIKDFTAAFVYKLYDLKIIKNNIKVYSVDETLDKLIQTDNSLVRFGDGEIVMIKGKSLKLQQASPEIAEGLKRILSYKNDKLMVSVQGVFDGLDMYHKKSQRFWKDHLLFCRKIYETYCDPDRIYCDTAVTRCYYSFRDKSRCHSWFEKFKKVWHNKEIIVVEGIRTHNGVGNDLFEGAASVERIICPPKDAYISYDRILSACKKHPKNKMFLLSVGVTAKFLAEDLFKAGYRVIDIGNLDMEYEWYLQGVMDKVPVKKHDIIGNEANLEAGYTEYLEQIKTVIE